MADLGRDDLRAPGLSVTSSVESSAVHVAQYHWARVNGDVHEQPDSAKRHWA